MKSNLIKNYIYNLSYQMLILFVPLITTPYVSRVLQETNIGKFSFFQSIVSYFVLFGCIGLNLYGQREVAFCKNSIRKRSRVFFELTIIRFVTLSISILAYFLLIVKNSKGFSLYYALFSIELFAAFFDISWFFQGLENFRLQTIRNVFVKIIGTVAIFLFVKTENDLGIYIVCYPLTTLLGNLSMWFYLPKYIRLIGVPLFGITKHIIPALFMFVPQIATSVYVYLDKTMIRLFSDYEQVAFYTQSEKIVKIVLTVVTSLGVVMLSRIANSFSSGDQATIAEYIKKSFRFVFIIAYPCMFGLIAITGDLVPWFFGEGYEQVVPCMRLLSPIVLFIGVSNVIGTQYLLPTNRMKQYTISVCCGLIVNVMLNTVLITPLGSMGAAVATVFAELAVTAVQFVFVRKEFNALQMIKSGKESFVAGAVMGVAVYALSLYLPSTLLSTLIEILFGGIVYILLLFALNERFVFDIAKKFIKG